MGIVQDVKPKGGLVTNIKPRALVHDVRPSILSVGKEQVVYIDDVMAYKGQSIGLLLALTYPVDTIIGMSTRL